MGRDEMRESCTETDCFCGTCDPTQVTYNVWKDLTAESDPYGQTPPCEVCGQEWAECNPFSGPHDVQFIQEYFESYWITAAVALNYFGPIPKIHDFVTPATVHDFDAEYVSECLISMKTNIEMWVDEMQQELHSQSVENNESSMRISER